MKSDLYFKHDLYALTDNKLRRLISKHSMGGYAVFFETVAILTRDDNHRYLYEELVNDLAYDLHTDVETVDEILRCAIDDCGLFFLEDGYVFSQRILDSYKEKEEFSKAQSERGKKGNEVRWGKKDIASATNIIAGATDSVAGATKNIAGATKTIANSSPNKQEQEQEQEQKQKQDKEKGNITDVIFPKKKDENEDSDSVSEESEFTLLNEDEEKVETVKDNTPYKEIADYWNQGASKAGYPQIAKLTNGRKVQIKCRWDEFGRDVFKAMDNVFKSDFLRKWGKCTIDWMMTPSKMLRAIEGMYRNDDEGEESDSSKPKKMYRDYSDITDEDLEKKFSWEK